MKLGDMLSGLAQVLFLIDAATAAIVILKYLLLSLCVSSQACFCCS